MHRLYELRKEENLKQNIIGKQVGLEQRNYSFLECEDTPLKSDILIKLSKHYNVSVDYILVRTDDRKPYPEINSKEYKYRLKELREEKHWKQKTLAKNLGTYQRKISRLENSKKISVEILEMYANFFGISVDYLLGLTNERLPHPKSKIEKLPPLKLNEYKKRKKG